MKNTIGVITDNQLCSACGACAAICPKTAIRMQLLPSGFFQAEIDTDECTECGLCLKCCPGAPQNVPEFQIAPKDSFLGFAEDPTIRAQSQSGGVVTALLSELLDRGEIDGAVLTRLDAKGNPEVIWADTKEKIRSAAGSVYAQSSVVKVFYEHRKQKCAVVTLGCQTEAILRTCKQLKGLKRPEYIIGLVCGGNSSLWMKEELLKKMRVCKTDEILNFHYRDKTDGGWPGNVTAQSAGHCYRLDKSIRMMLKPAFECYRCLLCAEKMNVHSDIVAGDPWQIDAEHTAGRSIVLTYTEKGKQLLDKVLNTICLEKASIEKVVCGQNVGKQYREKVLLHHQAARQMGKMIPYRMEETVDSDTGVARKRLHRAETFYNSKSKQKAMRLAHRTIRQTEQPIRNYIYNLKNKWIGEK